MGNKQIKKRILLLLAAVLLTGCASKTPTEYTVEAQPAEELELVSTETTTASDSYQLQDLASLYTDEDSLNLTTMYLTIRKGEDKTAPTWSSIHSDSQEMDVEVESEPSYVNALLQIGDEHGPKAGELGYGESATNVTVQVDKATSIGNAQKDYQIDIKNEKWNGQSTLILKKFQADGLRFANKMMFDLIKEIPQLVGVRTHFVHLYVKDQSVEDLIKFVDYGLYTQIEQLDTEGLINHCWDVTGQLYELKSFDFYRYEDVIKPESDPFFDKQKFNEFFKIKNNSDHTKLIKMLDAVNDHSISMDNVLEQYFDTENLAYWMGFMTLMGNVDAQSGHVFLYSPHNSEKWFFISSDTPEPILQMNLDGGDTSEIGVGNFWDNALFQRCLKSEKFRVELRSAVQDLHNQLSAEHINAMAESYGSVLKPYVYGPGDWRNASIPYEKYNQAVSSVADVIEKNYQIFEESLTKPTPFFIGAPALQNGKLHLNWDVAYDFQGEDVTYVVELAKDSSFRSIISRIENIRVPELVLDQPAVGQYFVHVYAQNESGKIQNSYDLFEDINGKIYGTKSFFINEDGTISEVFS